MEGGKSNVWHGMGAVFRVLADATTANDLRPLDPVKRFLTRMALPEFLTYCG
jgi:hypothetical protein